MEHSYNQVGLQPHSPTLSTAYGTHKTVVVMNELWCSCSNIHQHKIITVTYRERTLPKCHYLLGAFSVTVSCWQEL